MCYVDMTAIIAVHRW